MKLLEFSITKAPPLERLAVSALSDLVVFAGPNGVGKTTILTSLLTAFRQPGQTPNCRLRVASTCESERAEWGGQESLDTSVLAEAQKLRAFLQRSKKRGQLRSGVLNFDTDRTLQNIQPYAFTWKSADPDNELIGWDHTFGSAKSRFQDVVHSLFKKVQSRKEAISTMGLLRIREGAKEMDLDFPDPLIRFREAFQKLLPGKALLDLDAEHQQIQYDAGGTILPLSALSSGEREVVTIVFDFLLRDPKDCIVVFDEPELHLHPELSYRLLRTLRDVGERNQFILCTHSPDIITASIDQSVVFVAPAVASTSNQAVTVSEGDPLSHVMHMLGQSVGVISLGKRIVLIEGEKSSLDKEVYGSLVASDYPGLVLVPAGGKETIASFVKAVDSVLSQALWGVEFFMLCDGDAAHTATNADELERKSGGRLRFLTKYHLENYFLDEHVLARVFRHVEAPSDSPLRDPMKLRAILRDHARGFVSYAVALAVAHRTRTMVGNLDMMPSGCTGVDVDQLVKVFEVKRGAEHDRVQAILHSTNLQDVIREQFAALADALDRDDDEWKRRIPGRAVLKKIAADGKMDVGNLKRLYIRIAREQREAQAKRSKASYSPAEPSYVDPFADIGDIFEGFASFRSEKSPLTSH